MDARQNRKRLKKLIRGGFTVGKYASCGTVMLSLGCVSIDNSISVSEDGRYLAVQLMQDTKEVVITDCMESGTGGKSEFYIIDLLKKEAEFIGSAENAWGWLSNTKNQVAFIVDNSSDSEISVIGRGKSFSLSKASYPCLSGDGNLLAYSERIGVNESDCILYVKALPDGEPVKIADNGILANFSPDLKHLCFVVMTESEEEFYLFISNIDGTNQRKVDTISPEANKAALVFPHWIDNSRVIYNNVNEQSGEDGELFIVDLSGKITQITDNEDYESFYQFSKGGIFYGIEKEEPAGSDIPIYDLNYSKKVKDQWVQKKLGLSPVYYKIANDKIVYIAVEEEQVYGHKTSLYIANLDDVIQGKELSPIDLTDIIRGDDIKRTEQD